MRASGATKTSHFRVVPNDHGSVISFSGYSSYTNFDPLRRLSSIPFFPLITRPPPPPLPCDVIFSETLFIDRWSDCGRAWPGR